MGFYDPVRTVHFENKILVFLFKSVVQIRKVLL